MDVVTSDVMPIEAKQLSSWSVIPGGVGICLDFISVDARMHRIVLPFDALTGLLMTLPRMLQSALNEQFPDGSLRVVQQLRAWQLEQAEGGNDRILKLATPDGFEVAFAVNDEHADSLGEALLVMPRTNNPHVGRRPH